MRARIAAAAGLALVCGGAVLAVTETIDPVYQAKASTVAHPIVGDNDIQEILWSKEPGYRLRLSQEAPFVPQPARGLRRISAAAGVQLEDVEIVDTALQPLLADFRERPRRLKVVVERPDPRQAARDANAFLRALLDYRRSWYARELGETRRYLEDKQRLRRAGRSNFPSPPAYLEEEIAAAKIGLRLEQATLRGLRLATPPDEPVTPRKWRDALVAALIGGLVGWFMPVAWLPGRGRPPRDRRH